MRTDFRFVDMTQAPPGPEPPSVVLERQGGGAWYTPAGPVDQASEWVVTAEGDYVCVPLFRYRTNGRQPPTAMAFAFELGPVVSCRRPVAPGVCSWRLAYRSPTWPPPAAQTPWSSVSASP